MERGKKGKMRWGGDGATTVVPVRDGTGSSEGKTADGRRIPVEELAERGPATFPAMQ